MRKGFLPPDGRSSPGSGLWEQNSSKNLSAQPQHTCVAVGRSEPGLRLGLHLSHGWLRGAGLAAGLPSSRKLGELVPQRKKISNSELFPKEFREEGVVLKIQPTSIPAMGLYFPKKREKRAKEPVKGAKQGDAQGLRGVLSPVSTQRASWGSVALVGCSTEGCSPASVCIAEIPGDALADLCGSWELGAGVETPPPPTLDPELGEGGSVSSLYPQTRAQRPIPNAIRGRSDGRTVGAGVTAPPHNSVTQGQRPR